MFHHLALVRHQEHPEEAYTVAAADHTAVLAVAGRTIVDRIALVEIAGRTVPVGAVVHTDPAARHSLDPVVDHIGFVADRTAAGLAVPEGVRRVERTAAVVRVCDQRCTDAALGREIIRRENHLGAVGGGPDGAAYC